MAGITGRISLPKRLPFSEGEKFLKIQIVQAGFNIQSVTFNQVLGVDNQTLNPDNFVLGKPYPNPFNPSVQIDLFIEQPGQFQIEIHNLKGQLITNWSQTFTQSGNYFIHWNALDNHGVSVPSGIFFISVSDHKDNQREKSNFVKIMSAKILLLIFKYIKMILLFFINI